MKRSSVKVRAGGVLTRELEERVLAGETRALRALVRQAQGSNTLDLPFQHVELRAKPDGTGGERLLFSGYASVTEAPFEMCDWLGPYTEVMRAGCFTQTLSQNPDVIFCVNHDWDSVPMARTKAGTMRLAEDTTAEHGLTGLWCEAELDARRSDVFKVQSAMEAGELDAMSFAFWVVRQMWSPDYEQRDILEVDMDGGDASVVTWPANPATTGTTTLRKRAAQSLLRTRIPALVGDMVRSETRAGKALSSATMDTLQAVLDLIADADDALDDAQPLLAELMGVPNPDDDTVPDGDGSDGDQESQSTEPTGMSLARMQLLEDARRIA